MHMPKRNQKRTYHNRHHHRCIFGDHSTRKRHRRLTHNYKEGKWSERHGIPPDIFRMDHQTTGRRNNPHSPVHTNTQNTLQEQYRPRKPRNDTAPQMPRTIDKSQGAILTTQDAGSYYSLIGDLCYLVDRTCLDIAFTAVCQANSVKQLIVTRQNLTR